MEGNLAVSGTRYPSLHYAVEDWEGCRIKANKPITREEAERVISGTHSTLIDYSGPIPGVDAAEMFVYQDAVDPDLFVSIKYKGP